MQAQKAHYTAIVGPQPSPATHGLPEKREPSPATHGLPEKRELEAPPPLVLPLTIDTCPIWLRGQCIG